MPTPTSSARAEKAKWTPGPWRVHQHNHADGDLWLSIGHYVENEKRWIGPVADIHHLVAPDEEQWANARLIAAAPDLATLAQRVAEHFVETDAPLGVLARQLLARLEGSE